MGGGPSSFGNPGRGVGGHKIMPYIKGVWIFSGVTHLSNMLLLYMKRKTARLMQLRRKLNATEI